MERKSEIRRKTKETDIVLSLSADGTGKSEVNTGIGFFDHMLELMAKHGFLDLCVKAASSQGEMDGHHLVEDTGIVLGQALREVLGEKKSIRRYGTSFVPMDESLAMVSIDLSGRPFLVFDADFKSQRIGDMDTQLVEEFFRAVAFNSGMTLHIKVLYGKNDHHKVEAVFKAFGRALDEAVKIDGRIEGVMSTKGLL
ncbi:MAG: imidazoleglycerol-phosphate dehydratase HisB [Clostridiaceae bacterium]|nr:imidazoleglycerol-phosphate dehydratase HisB [Clostridiaceae bacterium]